MDVKQANILIVDDEPLLRDILKEYLHDIGYTTVEASNGADAWSILQQREVNFDAIILDRTMPKMTGIEVLKKIKADAELKMIPVIMQTGSIEKEAMVESLDAGCYYYLTKPYDEAVLLSIVKTAVSDYYNYHLVQEELKKQSQSLNLLDSGSFHFYTLEESRVLTTLLAAACPEPDKVAPGLSELLINAVEHGNLEISYNDKSHLLEIQSWEEEVIRRQEQSKYSTRHVSVKFERNNEEINITIEDQGNGFEWPQYMEISVERSNDNHGRGIAIANLLSFDKIKYFGNGNTVKATLYTKNQDTAATIISANQ